MSLRAKLLLGYLGFVRCARRARRMERTDAQPDERRIGAHHRRKLRFRRRRAGHERKPGASRLGCHLPINRRAERADRQTAEHRARFDVSFAKAASNITETGEADIIEEIRQERDEYFRRLDEFAAAARDSQTYFGVLQPLFDRVRATCDRLLRLNQEAMRRKADAASQIAQRWFVITLVLALVLMSGGVAVEISLSRSILGPVRQLTDATMRIAAGELDATVPVRAGDEIGALAAGFNRMAERIRELRRSDLGKLLIAQQTTEAAINSLFDPVLVTDAEGRLTRINPAAERLFGSGFEVIGKPIADVVRDPRVVQAVRDVLRSQVPVASESAAAVLPLAVEGAHKAFRVRSTPMHDADNRLVGAVTLLEDITHLNEISRMKSEFIAAASHELRTPLTSVQMGIHLVLEDTSASLSDRQREILYVCREDAARLDRLMRELLDLSKIESGDVTPVRVPVRPNVVLRESAESLRLQVEARGIRLDVDAPPDLPMVLADRDQIERVIGNLITNAARATQEGGTIAVGAALQDGAVAVSVTDTGTGIPRDYLTRIFEPFVQVPGATGGGAGLGLTISRRIIEGHGGQLSVQSESGKGTTFTFTIPTIPPAEVPHEVADHRR